MTLFETTLHFEYLPWGQDLHEGCALPGLYLPLGHVLHGLVIELMPPVSKRPVESRYFETLQLAHAVEV